MSFKNYFRNWIPTQWKTKMPTNMEWEIHSLHAYKDKKEAFAKGEISYDQLKQWEYEHRESPEQREFSFLLVFSL